MIKAIIFDLGGVLVEGWKIAYKRIGDKVDLSESQVHEKLRPILKKWNMGEIGEDELWRDFESSINVELPSDFKENFWLQNYIDNTKEIKGTFQILEKLKEKGMRFALLSNTSPTHIKGAQHLGIIGKLEGLGFENFIYSYEVKIRKPDHRIYQIASEKLNLEPSQCLFVDDREKNVEAAKEVGMEGIVFEEFSRLREELTKFNLL